MPDPCYGIIGHPELSTANSLFVSYYVRGYGPGVPGHPYPVRPLNHVLLAAVALGPGPVPDPAPVPTGLPPSKPTSVKVRCSRRASPPAPSPSLTRAAPTTARSCSATPRRARRATAASRVTAAHVGAERGAALGHRRHYGKRYTCTVRATNGWGASPPSVASAPFVVGAPNAPERRPGDQGDGREGARRVHAGADNGAAITNYTAVVHVDQRCARSKTAGPRVRSRSPDSLRAAPTRARQARSNSRGESPPSVSSPAVKA